MKKVIALTLVFALFLCPVADAYLGAVISLATVLRVGAVYVSHLWRNTAMKDFIVSGLTHLAAASALWLAYDRGTSVPASERYINVKLTNAENAIRDERNHHTPSTSRVYGDAENWQYTGCNGAGDWGWHSKTTGAYYCCTYDANCGGTCWGENAGTQYVGNNCFGNYTKCGYCSASVRNKYQETADNIINDAPSIQKVQAALGLDLTSGSPSLSSTPASGAYMVPVGGDVYETNNYTDARDYAGSGGTTSAAPSASEIGSAVGSAVNTNLTNIKTAVDGVKTSTDGIKTSTDGVKASVDAVKASTDTVKATLDAMDAKTGNNPGSAVVPEYDSSYNNPNENSITDRIGSFVGSNPIIGAISGSHLSLSGAVCSASLGSVFGKPLTLNFCWMESYLIMFGNVLVIFAGLTAAFIIFRRGD